MDRADNLIEGNKQEQFEQICRDIDDFKMTSDVDQIIVLWTANTERFCDILEGINDTADNLLTAIANNHPEISPSILFACAAITKNCTYINGSPQNTFVPGVLSLAQKHNVFLAGDDFKSGQTKIKSVLVDFLISAGIKPVSIVSYNHLGNNDGKNLSAPLQFRSKEVSKSNVVDDMVQSNHILYKPAEMPDHCVVIKYVPYVGKWLFTLAIILVFRNITIWWCIIIETLLQTKTFVINYIFYRKDNDNICCRGQQTRAGRIHVRDHDGRTQHSGAAQHLRRFSSRGPHHLGSGVVGRTMFQDGVQVVGKAGG